jgi:hypothetical protein
MFMIINIDDIQIRQTQKYQIQWSSDFDRSEMTYKLVAIDVRVL